MIDFSKFIQVIGYIKVKTNIYLGAFEDFQKPSFHGEYIHKYVFSLVSLVFSVREHSYMTSDFWVGR